MDSNEGEKPDLMEKENFWSYKKIENWQEDNGWIELNDFWQSENKIHRCICVTVYLPSVIDC